jgi:ATP-dependent helicase/nuclease subunit B
MEFLRQTATYLHQQFGNGLHEVLVLLPSRRAGQFLRKQIAEVYGKPVIAPGILAVEDFVEKCSGLQVLPRLDLTLRFYEHYQSAKGDEAESFASFMKWGPILLQDFNEIDRHLVKGDQLYDFLHDLERMKYWSPDAPEKLESPLIQRYLELARDAGTYYQTFAASLQGNKQGYQGMAYRTVAERPDETLRPWLRESGYKQVLAAGLNALNKCEEGIFEYLQEAGMLHLLWDADGHYLNDPEAEAGSFMRKYRNKWHGKSRPFTWIENHFAEKPKTIRILPVGGLTEQARAAGRLLSEVPKKLLEAERTALVLADENLLIPVIQALPEDIGPFNITMGYPLHLHPFSQAILQVLRMHVVAKNYQESRGRYAFYHKQLFEVMQHPLMRHLATDQKAADPFGTDGLRRRNVVYYSPDFLQEASGNLPSWSAVATLFQSPESSLTLISELQQKLEFLSEAAHLSPTDREVAWMLAIRCSRLADLVATSPFLSDLKTLEGLLADFLQEATVDFYGEPMKGLQIMGVLETRALDFDHLILTSVNEGTLPAGRSDFSMIPFDVKKQVDMPSFLEKDAVYAYHFYRLLQRAKNITLIYSTSDSGMGKGEPSRFIRQIVHELGKYPQIQIIHDTYLPEVRFDALKQAYEAPDEPELKTALTKMAESGFSPTSLSSYIMDPLNFYISYLLKIREDRGVEEEIFGDTLGKAVHQVLEDFYRPFLKSYPQKNHYKDLAANAEKLLSQAFKAHYADGHLTGGANLMIFKVGENMIKHYAREAEKLVGQNREVFALEDMLRTTLYLPEANLEVVLKGQADRIDIHNGVIHVIDYKTGYFNNTDIQFKEIEDLFDPQKKKLKAFQLMTYAWLLWRTNPIYQGYTAAIAPLRGDFHLEPLKFDKQTALSTKQLLAFETRLIELLETIFAHKGFQKAGAQLD